MAYQLLQQKVLASKRPKLQDKFPLQIRQEILAYETFSETEWEQLHGNWRMTKSLVIYRSYKKKTT